jgi:hypothetical protein
MIRQRESERQSRRMPRVGVFVVVMLVAGPVVAISVSEAAVPNNDPVTDTTVTCAHYRHDEQGTWNHWRFALYELPASPLTGRSATTIYPTSQTTFCIWDSTLVA